MAHKIKAFCMHLIYDSSILSYCTLQLPYSNSGTMPRLIKDNDPMALTSNGAKGGPGDGAMRPF